MKLGDLDNGGNAIFDIEEPLGTTVAHGELAINYALSHNDIPPTNGLDEWLKQTLVNSLAKFVQ